MPVTRIAPILLMLAMPFVAGDGRDNLDHALVFAEQQLTHAVTYLSNSEHARSTKSDGTWMATDRSGWTSGFFAGCLWYGFEATRESSWLTWASEQTADLEPEKWNTGDHDIGFRIMRSFGNGYRLTGDPGYRGVILDAAASLATRFDPVVGCLRSWSWGPWNYPVIIDGLMNLELLFWAAEHGGDPAWHDMAVSHATRTMQEHLRGDGSTFHVVDYDPGTGAVVWKGTYQGYSDSSTWARGQAWGIYGFTMAYRYTRENCFLRAALRLADRYLERLPGDFVPYWDFDAPGIPNEPRDTSAAAIAASALIELSRYVHPGTPRHDYARAAEQILLSLSSPEYLAEGQGSDGVLLHGVGNKPAGSEIDVSLIYGDCYFIEALLRRRSPRPTR